MDARLNITISGQNGDLPDLISFDLPDVDVKRIATEAVRTGGVPGVDTLESADFGDYVVDRFGEKDGLPARVILRPKTPFGG